MKWHGWKKELPWIFFFIMLMVMAYGYYDLQQELKTLLEKDCVWGCLADEFIDNVKEEHPGWQVTCDPELRKCMISGAPEPGLDLPADFKPAKI